MIFFFLVFDCVCKKKFSTKTMYSKLHVVLMAYPLKTIFRDCRSIMSSPVHNVLLSGGAAGPGTPDDAAPPPAGGEPVRPPVITNSKAFVSPRRIELVLSILFKKNIHSIQYFIAHMQKKNLSLEFLE